MTDIDKYRRGYERGKADIAKSRGEKLADMPEVVVKGLIGLPGEAVRDFLRSADEDRGYRDALDGKEFSPGCESCGSLNHAAHDCPRDLPSSACERCGSKDHNEAHCPHRVSSRSAPDTSTSSSSDNTGCGLVIGGLIAAALIIAAVLWVVSVVLWLVFNVILPVALLNSVLILTVLALSRERYRTALAALSLFAGGYMLFDIASGWLSANFVNNVVHSPQWLTGFVYINAAAVGVSTWLLVQPMLLTAGSLAISDKRRSLLWSGSAAALICVATVLLPLFYHTVANPSDRRIVSTQRESTSTHTVVVAPITPAQPLAHSSATWTETAVADERFVLHAVINDPDGYTNVRALKSASSDIVATVQADEEFYTFDQSGRWWQVKTKAGKSGYMHVSRIRLSRSNLGDTFLDRFSDIDTRILRPNDLQGLSASELGLLRNFVFARHGRSFAKPVYRSYFLQFGWYRPDPSYSDSLLNGIERANVEIIRRQEASGGATN